MDNYIIVPDGSMNFETISEFKRSLSWGAEIEFVWNNVTYGVIRYGTNNKITIYQANRPETEKVCDTADDALEYMLGDDRLRDVITKVNVISRTIQDKSTLLAACKPLILQGFARSYNDTPTK